MPFTVAVVVVVISIVVWNRFVRLQGFLENDMFVCVSARQKENSERDQMCGVCVCNTSYYYSV